MSDLIEVCGLWTNDGQKGEYLSGSAGKLRYFVFPNKSDNPKAPSHRLLIAENKPREDKVRDNDTDEPF